MTLEINEPSFVLRSDETGAVAVSVQAGTWGEWVTLMDPLEKNPGDLLRLELSHGRLSGRVMVPSAARSDQC